MTDGVTDKTAVTLQIILFNIGVTISFSELTSLRIDPHIISNRTDVGHIRSLYALFEWLNANLKLHLEFKRSMQLTNCLLQQLSFRPIKPTVPPGPGHHSVLAAGLSAGRRRTPTDLNASFFVLQPGHHKRSQSQTSIAALTALSVGVRCQVA